MRIQSQGKLLSKGQIQKAFLEEASLFLSPEPRGEAGLGTHLCAAKATAVDSTVLRVSFPPKPPPILFTRTTIRLAGTPNIFATKFCGRKQK